MRTTLQKALSIGFAVSLSACDPASLTAAGDTTSDTIELKSNQTSYCQNDERFVCSEPREHTDGAVYMHCDAVDPNGSYGEEMQALDQKAAEVYGYFVNSNGNTIQRLRTVWMNRGVYHPFTELPLDGKNRLWIIANDAALVNLYSGSCEQTKIE